MNNLDRLNEHDVAFIAKSKESIKIYSLAKKVAKFNVPVLITGETGTGKECVAKYIHYHSLGSRAPYVAINCAAIPESMLEAMLFGYEKGAFTSAVNSMPGKFEQANGGTLLLDEIGDMPFSLQAKLLRVLQEGEVERLGSQKKISLNIRLIASTNKDLMREIVEGRFRKDLFYRLSVVPIHLPPLRMRSDDILPLAQQFIQKYHSFYTDEVVLTESAKTILLDYHWPGNIRELENVIQRSLIMSTTGVITDKDLDISNNVKNFSSLHDDSKVLLNTNEEPSRIRRKGRLAEYQYIIELLKQYNGNKSKTAQYLGITPRALRYRLASMRECGLDPSI